jgi:sideroflexin-1/3
MVLVPMVMNQLEKRGTLKKIPWANAPIQIGLVGLILTFATPMCCAIFQQQASIKPTDVEPELQAKLRSLPNPPEILYYNKGL